MFVVRFLRTTLLVSQTLLHLLTKVATSASLKIKAVLGLLERKLEVTDLVFLSKCHMKIVSPQCFLTP